MHQRLYGKNAKPCKTKFKYRFVLKIQCVKELLAIKVVKKGVLIIANEKYKPQIPDIMEAIFDAGYLIFDLIAGILFFAFSKGNPLFILYGVLTLTLCGGDAFHLVPRIIRAVHGSNDKIKGWLAYDSKNLCIYVDYRNGTSAFILRFET